jgi:Zn finger protein HypA/HybF involved in hydrogenase expression
MPIAPKPYKLKCQKCGYSKIVKIKSDALTPMDILVMTTTCSKCKAEMERVEMGILDKLFSI